MGTSTRWRGPAGQRWSSVGKQLPGWHPHDDPRNERRAVITADRAVHALHTTVRAHPEAFELRGTAEAAGDRLVGTLAELAAGDGLLGSTDDEEFLARFTARAAGTGGTLTDAAIRRGAVTTAQRILAERAEAGITGPAPGDLLCSVFQWFFADVVAAFLHAVVAENVKLAVPLLPAVDPEDRIAELVADKVVALVPNPCEEAAERVAALEAAVLPEEEPLPTLLDVARDLVPRSTRRALGLAADHAEEAEDAAHAEDAEAEDGEAG